MVVPTGLRRRLARSPFYKQPIIIIKLDGSTMGRATVAVLALEVILLFVNLFVLSETIALSVHRVIIQNQSAPAVTYPITPDSTPTLKPRPTSAWVNSAPHNSCVGIASIQVKFGIQANVLSEPSRNADELRTLDTGDGWMSANARAGRWWHVCNFGWVDVDDVDAIVWGTPEPD